jgi:hypothetical protein
MKTLLLGLALLVGCHALPVLAADELVTSVKAADGDTVRYVLTSVGTTPHYAVILMPGGNGVLPLQPQDGKLTGKLNGNFLIRSRTLFADSQFVAASTSATSTPGRMLAIVQDLERRYGKIAVYVIGTSRSTESTLALAGPLDGQVAGFIHTSSMNRIANFDPRALKSRHLIVAHSRDTCRVTKPANAEASHRSYGTDLILMDGGKTVGDDCEPWAYHGYNGIEKETVDKIKAWILAGK